MNEAVPQLPSRIQHLCIVWPNPTPFPGACNELDKRRILSLSYGKRSHSAASKASKDHTTATAPNS
jgi:hypothetical protein